MLLEEYVDSILNNGWIEEIEPGKLGDHHINETYQLKEGAPEWAKKEWEELCEKWTIAG
jgi:hypothetical protein